MIAMPDHADSSGFFVRISPRANPENRVVIDRVPISSHAELSIGFVVAGGHRVLEASMELEVDHRHAPLFLFLSRVLKIVIFAHREWQRSEHEPRAH
jgi:hypothetical protein